MAPLKNLGEKTSLMEVLTSNDDNLKLQHIQGLKNYFTPPDKILRNIKLISLLQDGKTLLKSKNHTKDFLLNYGTSLINYIGKDTTLDVELLTQVEYIVVELQEQDGGLIEKLLLKVSQLQNESFLQFNGILKASKHFFEKIILNVVENNDNLQTEFLIKMSAKSAELFQTVISILYLIMVKTNGHWRVFEVTKSFLSSVLSFCEKNDKDFLGLYPENCRRLVALLTVSPELYADEIIKKEVLELMLELFLTNRKTVLTLLSHYPDWLYVFRNFLVERSLNC